MILVGDAQCIMQLAVKVLVKKYSIHRSVRFKLYFHRFKKIVGKSKMEDQKMRPQNLRVTGLKYSEFYNYENSIFAEKFNEIIEISNFLKIKRNKV